MTVLTVGTLRDLLANLDADTPVRLSMDMDLYDYANAVYVLDDVLVLDNVTSGLNGVGGSAGGSVLFNAFA